MPRKTLQFSPAFAFTPFCATEQIFNKEKYNSNLSQLVRNSTCDGKLYTSFLETQHAQLILCVCMRMCLCVFLYTQINKKYDLNIGIYEKCQKRVLKLKKILNEPYMYMYVYMCVYT